MAYKEIRRQQAKRLPGHWLCHSDCAASHPTWRRCPAILGGLRPERGGRRPRDFGSIVTASRRLAAHRRGRARSKGALLGYLKWRSRSSHWFSAT